MICRCILGQCECYDGFSVGPSTGVCDTHTPSTGLCDGVSCQNAGTCVERTNVLTGNDEAHCNCITGWMGDNCETVDGCANYDCNGHGECVMYLGSTPRCVCDDPLRFSGDNCETETCLTRTVCDDGTSCGVEYSGLTCQNGGSCNFAGSECACPFPYEGTNCQTENWCRDNPCIHGTCSNAGKN